MGAVCCGEPIDFDGEVDLRHFELLRSVGKGAFGKVRIVQKKNDKKMYALKYINKFKCIKMKAVNNVIQERRLLEEVDFPLIVNMRYAFQDDENLFMVLDLMLGGDVRFHLERNGPFKEEIVRFYVAEIALSLRYLHVKNIVHRDLKPDNVLLDENGHAHLTDFNIAVRYTDSTPLKSVAGSMAYMAPEVLQKKGYYASPDWWSLGVMMYEMLFGKRPYRGKTNEALTNSILNDTLVFPNSVEMSISRDCLDVVKGLLERDITRRLGCGDANYETLKAHPFFTRAINGQSIDWDKLSRKEQTPPFKPDSKRANFDASHELEELLLEENPLRAKKRAGKRDYSRIPGGENGEIAKDLDLMERKFINFNYERKAEIRASAPSLKQEDQAAKKQQEPEIGKTASSQEEEDSMHDLQNFRSEHHHDDEHLASPRSAKNEENKV